MPLSPKAGLALAALAALSLVAARPAAAQTINTLPDQNDEIQPFGVTDTATYGQTIISPVTGTLQDFVFNVNNDGGTPITADAEVYAYNSMTNMASGPALSQSAPFTIAPNGAFTLVTAPSGAAVTAGSQYVLLFTTSGLQAGQPNSSSHFGTSPNASYTSGAFVFMNNGDDHSQITSSNFDTRFSDRNLAFKADFTPASTPEPSSFAAFGFVGLGLAGLALKARKKAAAPA